MNRSDVAAEAAVGFFTVVESEPHGLIGGYLVLNALARPLEFHCTAPVKPNRAQEILYGATLESFLYGEQLGQTLLAATKLDVPLVLTDVPAALAVAELARQPVALVLGTIADEDAIRPSADVALRHDAAHAPRRPHAEFTVGRHRLSAPAADTTARQRITAAIERLGAACDLAEPFARIREAIAEAQRAPA